MYELGITNDEIIISRFNNIYYFEHGKHFKHPPEYHNFWEMVYIDKGNVIAYTDGVTSILSEGQAIFHKPGEYHSHISDNKVANNIFVVSFVCTSECMKFFESKTFTLDKTSKTLLSLFIQETKNALGKISGDYFDDSKPDFSKEIFGSSQLMKCHFTEFLIKLIRSGDKLREKTYNKVQSRLDGQNLLVNHIISYLENNLYNKVTLGDICDRFFIKKSRLSVLFKEQTGKSPIQYYSDLKIQEAKKLLREETLSVSEISDYLGFSSIHNFSRSFKLSTGFSPTGYKKSITFL